MFIKLCTSCNGKMTRKNLADGRPCYVCETPTCPAYNAAILITSPISIKRLDRKLYDQAVEEAKRRGMTIGAFTSLCYSQYFNKSKKSTKEVNL